ncbi:MAG: hypothetical protein SOZ00_05070 [Tidjanibacter sp.]|nr:hypothetical protein [Tidjanibacter sp.]
MKRNYNYPTISLSEIVVEQGIAASGLQGASIMDSTEQDYGTF